MSFQTRNLYHLRVNMHSVLPLYLYLDEKHVDWMTRGVLNEIISDLKPLIGPKLAKESHIGTSGLSASAAKKAGQSAVEVHRGGNYQFAYFLKPAESYDLIIKARDFVPVTVPADPLSPLEGRDPTPEQPTTRRTAKKKRAPKSKSRPKVSAAARKRKRVEESEEEDTEMSDAWSDLDEEIPPSDDDEAEAMSPGTAPIRRSTRHKDAPQIHNVDEEMRDDNEVGHSDAPNQPAPAIVKSEPDDATDLDKLLTISAEDEVTQAPLSQSPRPPSDTLVVEQEEEKPKQELQLAYTGYMVPSRCLCVIAEPWPALPTPAQLASQALKPRSKPPAPSPPGTSRPLFRPESDDEDEQPNAHAQRRSPTPEFDSDDEEARLRMFSQMINKVGGQHSGVATRGAMDEFEDDALYGDADEEGRGI